MSEVRVEAVTKVFHTSTGLFGVGRGPRERVRELQGRNAPGEPLPEDAAGLAASGGGPVRALDGVSLRIADGEAMAIIGPSGCGKTTLLRVIAGLESPDSGRIYYDADDVTDTQPKDRGIGIVFQNYALYPHMESKKNLAFFFWMHDRDKEIDERVKITSEILGVGFEDLLDRKPKTLSGGQQQRVAIGRCIIREPRLFLFDEPLSNLDAKLRSKTRVEIKRLLNRFKITAVYVTHDQVEAISLGDRICVMRHGKIEQVGTYWDIFDRPANQFVAGFVGVPPMNLIAATVESGELRFVGGAQALDERLGRLVTAGQAVTLGIRPQHVKVGPPGDPGAFAGLVEVVEPIPSDRVQIVHVLAGRPDGDEGERLELAASVPLENRVQRGDVVSMHLDAEHVHLFDPKTELALVAV